VVKLRGGAARIFRWLTTCSPVSAKAGSGGVQPWETTVRAVRFG
jgi:hypothetical protein